MKGRAWVEETLAPASRSPQPQLRLQSLLVVAELEQRDGSKDE